MNKKKRVKYWKIQKKISWNTKKYTFSLAISTIIAKMFLNPIRSLALIVNTIKYMNIIWLNNLLFVGYSSMFSQKRFVTIKCNICDDVINSFFYRYVF